MTERYDIVNETPIKNKVLLVFDGHSYFHRAYNVVKNSNLTEKETIETKNIVLTLLFINTFESYANNISNESMTDGLMRRFNLIYTEKDSERDFTDYSLYNLKKIRDETLQDKISELFNSIKPDQNFTFSDNCFKLYQKYMELLYLLLYQVLS